jgi:hypothetical protein
VHHEFATGARTADAGVPYRRSRLAVVDKGRVPSKEASQIRSAGHVRSADIAKALEIGRASVYRAPDHRLASEDRTLFLERTSRIVRSSANKSKAFVDEDRAKLLTVLLATLWIGFSVGAVWIVMIAGGTNRVRPELHP